MNDSTLTKTIRPIILLVLLIVFIVLSIVDGNVMIAGHLLAIKSAWIDCYQSLLMIAIAFYFGSRGAEKIAGMKQKN